MRWRREAPNADQPLRETEQAAYHAFREWPLLLVIRQKELAALQTPPPKASATDTEKKDEKTSVNDVIENNNISEHKENQ